MKLFFPIVGWMGCLALQVCLAVITGAAQAQGTSAPTAPVKPVEACPRPPIGSTVTNPPEVRSSNGLLNVEFSFRSSVDVYGLTLYCYIYKDTLQAPTLRVHPGDQVVLTLKNQLTTDEAASPHVHGAGGLNICGGGSITAASTNLHFHGLDLPPICHQDDVLHTVIQPSPGGFEYRIKIPGDESPGLYWYHPHPHGYTEAQVLGGASGALIVEGIEQEQPQVAGLPESVLVLRDQRVPGFVEADEDAGPGKDVSLNFVPVMYPLYQPTRMIVRPGERQLWRVLNASADTYFDLQIRHGATIQDVSDPQEIELVSIDGVPLESASKRTDILISPGARAEFVATTPQLGVIGQLVMLRYDTGPDGSATPYRAIANIRSSNDELTSALVPSGSPAKASSRHLPKLSGVKPVQTRKLYFSEIQDGPNRSIKYFITVEGETPKPFDMNFKTPDITAQQGTVEDWIIENRAREAHAFHIHQLHFQVLERDGQPLNETGLRDTIDLPYWDGQNPSYPSVKLRMDFRGPNTVGTFVYHCHILEHEDGGMMGAIRVKPAGAR